MTYCEYTASEQAPQIHRIYHDTQYGFPLKSDNELFGRLILEINQAGLSWTTILNKQENFREAYANFDIDKVAGFTEKDREKLLNNAGIIRNKLKVNAAIHNAQKIQTLQKEYGSFVKWLEHYHPLTKQDWVKLFKKTFVFTGGEITNEFLMSTGFLQGAHQQDCPTYKEVLKKNPAWNQK